MSLLQQFWHVLNFLAPALVTAAIAATAAKLLWRRELGSASWLRLVLWSGFAGDLALVGGLWLAGRDGSMPTYGAMVLAVALVIWLVGFGPFRVKPR
jgi:hypothetical protein